MKRVDAVNYALNRLSGLNDKKAEAEWLVALVIKGKRSDVYANKELTEEERKMFLFALSEREKGVPLAYIFHSAEFYGIELEVNNNVLIPRPETEELVSLALKHIGIHEEVLDIGTGSGAIAIAIAKNSSARVTAVDISKEAIKMAKHNAVTNNVKIEFIVSDLFEKLENRTFDCIISNPPYIDKQEYEALDDLVKENEPKLALYGGEDGLDFYRRIIADAPKFIKRGGKIFFEIGYNQGKDVAKLLEKDFYDIKIQKDLEGQERMVYASIKEGR
ncbi:MAG: peptide chain release factor N(5)-glutamine methyltransferase [Clostridia bacterium]|nr:peptide chain release factor N(5)-glutamine methyltransferase [Clostridia bacterium]